MVLNIAKALDHLRYTIARWPLMVAMTTGWLPARRAGDERATERSASAAALHGSDT